MFTTVTSTCCPDHDRFSKQNGHVNAPPWPRANLLRNSLRLHVTAFNVLFNLLTANSSAACLGKNAPISTVTSACVVPIRMLLSSSSSAILVALKRIVK
ncbi:hypothetical protein HNY73_007563 [Argiope bruennichi]|uniref:Uncharacterized protein n=1 Tax=Argiope bruennichi TaxID=94029 RepID=A0A8T0FEA7_ARGBR|nr:hypothetical protein HNY73_007563 [Argiope bruennichi]